MGAIFVGRVVGLLVDGFDKTVVVPHLVAELVMFAIFVAAYMQFS